MTFRVRSSPVWALDHDVVGPCVAGAVEGANRVRSPRSSAFDLDSFWLCEAAASELRSTGSTRFPDHCSTAESVSTRCATRGSLAGFAAFVNENRLQFREEMILVQSQFLYT